MPVGDASPRGSAAADAGVVVNERILGDFAASRQPAAINDSAEQWVVLL